MAEIIATNNNTEQTTLTRESPYLGHPQEQLDFESEVDEDDIFYPTGPKLWLTMTSMCIAFLLNGLDLTIVAVAVPSLTGEFKTMNDIGWYSAAYGLTLSAFVFFFGKAYTIFSSKSVFIFGIATFEVGSLLCTFAQSSKTFIVGRAVAGLGVSAMGGGQVKIIRHLFPLRKIALMSGLVGGCQSVGLVSAPMVGGALIDAFGWRACFGINLPLGVLCIAFTAYGFHDPMQNPDSELGWLEKLKRLDLLGTLLAVPAITCFLMALQWGGIKYGWNDARIISMLVLFGVLSLVFGYVQYRQGDDATIPLRILTKRSVLGATWSSLCNNGILAMTEYYMSIYFQGVRGLTATQAGLLGIPLMGGLSVAAIAAMVGTTMAGYYYPFLFATSVLAPIASGLLTTLDLNSSIAKAASLIGFLGATIGLSVQAPILAVQTALKPKDVSIGGGITLFGAGMGSALSICLAATLFQNRLTNEVSKYSPAVNGTVLESIGLAELRDYLGRERLQGALLGYNEAVMQTLYLPMGLSILTVIGSVAMERKSLKKKQE